MGTDKSLRQQALEIEARAAAQAPDKRGASRFAGPPAKDALPEIPGTNGTLLICDGNKKYAVRIEGTQVSMTEGTLVDLLDSVRKNVAKHCCRLMCWACDNTWPCVSVEGYLIHTTPSMAPDEVCKAAEIRSEFDLGTEDVTEEGEK